MAKNKSSELAYVHIVPVSDNDQAMSISDDDNNEDDDAEDYNSLLDSSSDEEAEFWQHSFYCNL